MPILTIIAGANGSGKSTITQSLDFTGRDRLMDPDSIARDLNPLNPSAATIAAGRSVLQSLGDYLSRELSFSIETTLSSRRGLLLMHTAHSRGYRVNLLFIGLDSPDRCITRIRNRAVRGGHFIPDADVRRRYIRSMQNGAQALRFADAAKFHDNSGETARLFLAANAGNVIWKAEPFPTWFHL